MYFTLLLLVAADDTNVDLGFIIVRCFIDDALKIAFVWEVVEYELSFWKMHRHLTRRYHPGFVWYSTKHVII